MDYSIKKNKIIGERTSHEWLRSDQLCLDRLCNALIAKKSVTELQILRTKENWTFERLSDNIKI